MSRLFEVLHPASKATTILIPAVVNLNSIEARIDYHLHVLLICFLAERFFTTQLALVHAVTVVVIPPHLDFLRVPIVYQVFQVRENIFVNKWRAVLGMKAPLISSAACLPAIIHPNMIIAKVQQGCCNAVNFAISRGNSVHNRANLLVGDIEVIAIPRPPSHGRCESQAIVICIHRKQERQVQRSRLRQPWEYHGYELIILQQRLAPG